MDDSERDALEQMISLAASYETTAQALLDMDWVVDGVSPFEASVFVSLGSISEQSAAVAESVLAQAWVVDGVSRAERRAIRGLRGIASDVAVAKSIIALSWVADGISDSEASAITGIAGKSARFAESVIALSWVADGVSDNEADAISSLSRISNSSAIAESVIAMPWLADGVSDAEARGISGLRDIAGKSAAIAESVIAMPWVVDGVSDAEASDIARLDMLAGDNAAIAERVIALPWVADGISDNDKDAIEWLYIIATGDGDAALQVVGMPFLQTLEGADVAALETLARLSADRLEDLLSLPTLKDGITDDDAPVVAMRGWEPDVVDKTLASESTMIERRTVDLPLAGEVDLVIVRARPVASRGMDLFENAVREAENLMGEPFPARYRYIGLLYTDSLGGGGHTDGISGIYIHSMYDADGSRGGRSVLAHEVAHFYWFWGAGWINEGMAEFMASAIENRRVGTPIDFTRRPCEFARNLKELEELAPRADEPAHICRYSLGEGLFVSLLRTLGEDAFWEGARSLYAETLSQLFGVSLRQARWWDYPDDPAGIDEVRQAFGADASDVIARWYGGR